MPTSKKTTKSFKLSPSTRKKIEAHILKYVSKIDASGINSGIYKRQLKSMDDRTLMRLIDKPIPIYDPNGSDVDIDYNRNFEIGRELGFDFFQRIRTADPVTGGTSLTRHKHLILQVPLRRQSQLTDVKVKIPEHNRKVDSTSGQPTDKSKGSSFSFPQTYIMYAKGYDNTIKELLKIRGGNTEAGTVIDRQIRETGSSSQLFPGAEKTAVKSTKVLAAIYKAMHIQTNFGER